MSTYYYYKLENKNIIPDDAINFHISLSNVEKLPELPQCLEMLKCNDNKLVELPELPGLLQYLYCYKNKLVELPYLPETLLDIKCYINKITELPELPVNIDNLECSYNNIKYLSLHNCQVIKNINSVIISRNPIYYSFNSVKEFQESL